MTCFVEVKQGLKKMIDFKYLRHLVFMDCLLFTSEIMK